MALSSEAVTVLQPYPSPLPLPLGANLRLKAQLKRVTTLKSMSANVGTWEATPDKPRPTWAMLSTAPFWRSSRPKFAALRERLTSKPPEFTVVQFGEEQMKATKVELKGVTMVYTVYKVSGDEKNPTKIPAGQEGNEFRAVLLDAELGQVPDQVAYALDRLTPTLLYGGTETRQASYVRELMKKRGDLVSREVTVYLKAENPPPSALTPCRVGALHILASPGSITTQVCTPPPPLWCDLWVVQALGSGWLRLSNRVQHHDLICTHVTGASSRTT